MSRWLRRLRGTLGMGLTWALGWSATGVLIGVASMLLPQLPWERFFEVFDAPLPAFGVPGFFAGVLFSTVFAVAGRRRSVHDLSVARVTAWGAASGFLLTLLPFALVAIGLGSREGSAVSDAQILAVITVPFVLLSAGFACGTVLLARRGVERGDERDALSRCGRSAGQLPAAASLQDDAMLNDAAGNLEVPLRR